jgi:hypothetical protein
MLPSADGIWRRNHHKTGPDWFVNVGALVAHLFSLWPDRWPDGSAPVVLTGTREQDLKDAKEQLIKRGMDPDECARLRAVPFTLSQQTTMKDFEQNAFMDAPHLPRWASVQLVERSWQTVVSAARLRELLRGRSRDDKTDKGTAWKNTLR